jgi:putative transposase
VSDGLRKAFKFKLKPTPEQERVLAETLWRCRMVYNIALEQRITAYRRCGVTLTAYEQMAELPDLKAAFPEYAAINSQVLQDVIMRVERAFQAFFRRIKVGEKAGYPRFRGRNRYNCFTFKQVGEHGGARLDDGCLVLSKIGRVAVRWSRPLEGTPKTVTIRREADGWYASISCADVPIQPLPVAGQDIGIDLGLESFATLADGSRIANPRIFRAAELNLKRAQKRVSRRKLGSNRRRKAVSLLAKAHQHVRCQRADFHHKTALALVRQYDTIYHEDLRPANLLRNHALAKSIADAGWSAFLSILSFKAVCAGRSVIAVPPAHTSQTCSGCGAKVQKGLSVRWHHCPTCGTSLHRDHNAALNIQRAGQALRGVVA